MEPLKTMVLGANTPTIKTLKPYTFDLTLRLRHPRIRHDEISRTLNLQPRFKWNAGELRRTPDGTALGGFRDHTYWACEIVNDKGADLIDSLDASLSALDHHKDFLQDFVATGGEIEYFIGWFTTDTSGGDALGWELLARLAKLKINISLDVYGSKQNSEPERAEKLGGSPMSRAE